MQQLNGWLILNKPLNVSSAKAVAIVKRALKVKKIGHAGTLDPLASGVLPLAIGEATKTVQYAMLAEKQYEFTVKWGEATATDDCEGEVTATSAVRPDEDEILAILPEFTGIIQQTPPAYSAIKLDGRRAYDMARRGENVELKPREVVIHKLELTASDKDGATFSVNCGKGTYVRSLARDIAEKLGTKGHVTALKRTKVGSFSIKDAILLENLEKTVYKPASSDFILPVNIVLDDIPVLLFTAEDAIALKQGKKVEFSTAYDTGNIVSVESEGCLVAIAEICDGYIKPVRVFNL